MNYLTASGIALIKKFEGCKFKSYNLGDGKWTGCYGATYHLDGTPIKEGETFTKDECDALFEEQIKSYVRQVRRAVKTTLNDSQFSALVSYNYNRGYGNFLKSQVLTLVNINPNDPAIHTAFLDVSMVKPQFQAGILQRRKQEYALYAS